MESTNHATDHGAGEGHYLKLGAMTAVMFIAMFALMYAMVDRVDNVYVNINQFYMAGLMTAAMVLIELAIMRGMYPRKGVNAGLATVSALSFALFWVGIREQSAVSDHQFLRSMIPHHASAIHHVRGGAGDRSPSPHPLREDRVFTTRGDPRDERASRWRRRQKLRHAPSNLASRARTNRPRPIHAVRQRLLLQGWLARCHLSDGGLAELRVCFRVRGELRYGAK